MRTFKQIISKLAMGCVVAINLTSNVQAQFQFTDVHVLPEEGVQLRWRSESNSVYRIEYATELVNGNTAWGVLYDDYPSHGTNTFWTDTGDYDHVPAVPYFTKAPIRFYRVFNKGTNSATAPAVSITSTTNGATLSGEIIISVAASSSLPVVTTSLFVDGQEMDSSEDGTNYVINTCEWPNGAHVLFATAKAQSALSGPSGPFPIDIGRAVSEYKAVTFDNLIHKVGFGEPFFEPSLGQTQQVTAAFAANVDWTLQMIDESSNAVRTVTGSGVSLQYNWDGTGDGGTNIPNGVYYYLISAQTNGQAFSGGGSGGGSDDGLPALSDFALSTKLSNNWFPTSANEAMIAGLTSYFLSAPPYPPVFTNGQWVAWKHVYGTLPLIEVEVPLQTQEKFLAALQGLVSMDPGSGAAAAYAGPSGQSTVAPKKPPTKPVKNAVGTVGVAFYNYATSKTYGVPLNGLPLPGNSGKVQMEGSFGNIQFDPIPEAPTAMKKFTTRMARSGWKLGFNKSGANLSVSELKKGSLGGGDLFGSVNLGLFVDHGNFGTGVDFHGFASQSKQTYFASDNPADISHPWIAFSEFGFGGGNLRWMAVLACNSLHDDQYQSMLNKGVLPLQSGNHVICGLTTIGAIGEDIGEIWAKKMLGSVFSTPKIKDAWFDAGHDQYQNATNLTGITITFRAFGWEDCMDDKLDSYSPTTSGDIVKEDRQVYP